MPCGATCRSTKVVRRQKAGAEWEWGAMKVKSVGGSVVSDSMWSHEL